MLLALLLAAPLPAQLRDMLWINLSGDWRMIDGDQPQFAALDFDDARMKTARLPMGELIQEAPHWLRRRVILPDGTDRTRLALTVGAIQDVYEVYVNGRKIGASGNFDSFEDARIPKPRTFPFSVDGGEPSIEIALRVKYTLHMVPVWRLPDNGPYVLSYRENAPLEAGQMQADERWFRLSPSLVFATLYLAMGLLGFVAWRSEPGRRELFWFSMVGLQGFATAFYVMTQLRGDFRPFSSFGHAVFQEMLDLVQSPLLGMVALSALGNRSRGWRIALWLGWGIMPLGLLLHTGSNIWATLGNLWDFVLIVVVVVRDWWGLRRERARREEHLLRLVLLLPGLSNAEYWISVLLNRTSANASYISQLGSYLISRDDLFLLSLLLTILALLFRRIGADRRDHQRLAGELAAARTVQQTLLVKPASGVDDIPIDVAYEPARDVGGDFYQVIPMADGGLMLLVGDVSGKGLNAAMLVSVVIGASRRNTCVSAGEMLVGLNASLLGYTNGGFVTCCCARLKPGGELQLANAGHLAPYRNGREVEVPAGLPLGLIPDPCYEETQVQLASGDQVTFLTDGVVEATNASGELFGFDRTRDVSTKAASEIAEAAKAWGQNDDITVVTVRREGCC
jgi:hypothetical protein